MAIRNDLSVNWEVSPRIITIAAPSTTITIQDLHDTCRDIEDNLPEAQEFDHLIDSAGKEPLGGGAYVGITATLQNAKLAFEARPGPTFVSCTVTGGNLVAVDANGDNMDPIQTTDYTQVTIAQSSSPTIATPESDYGLLYLVETLRSGTGTSTIGNIYYWDPGGGLDTNAGTTPTTAKATFSAAHDLCTDGNNDIIFALATDASGVTTVTTPISITKDGVKLRGPGYPLHIVPASAGSDTITISANNVEVSGLYVETAGSGTDNGISIAGNNNLIRDVWVANAQGNGISITNSTRTKLQTCAIENAGQSGTGNGISIGAATTLSNISDCVITGSADDGVDIAASGTITDNIFENNVIYNNGGSGIEIGTNALRTGIRLHHTFAQNTTASITDNGTSTFQDTSGAITSGDIDSIVSGVWDELITGHLAANTTGKALQDAKTRATLASLK